MCSQARVLGASGRDQFVLEGRSSKEDVASLLPASRMERFWIFCPRECFLSRASVHFQLSCPGLVLTRHLGHALGATVKNLPDPVELTVWCRRWAPPGHRSRITGVGMDSICRGTEARGLWAGDRGDLGSATAEVQDPGRMSSRGVGGDKREAVCAVGDRWVRASEEPEPRCHPLTLLLPAGSSLLPSCPA